MKKLFFIIVLVVMFTGISNAQVYYINSATGADTNSGTQEKPFASWSKALDVLKQNDIVRYNSPEDKPEFGTAVFIISKQDDRQSSNAIEDKGNWNERIVKTTESSASAGLTCITEYKYDIGETKDGKKYIRCIEVQNRIE